jgi:hypothetical protein
MILNMNKISVNMNMISVIEEVCFCCIGKFGNGFTTGIPKHIYISVHDYILWERKNQRWKLFHYVSPPWSG